MRGVWILVLFLSGSVPGYLLAQGIPCQVPNGTVYVDVAASPYVDSGQPLELTASVMNDSQSTVLVQVGVEGNYPLPTLRPWTVQVLSFQRAQQTLASPAFVGLPGPGHLLFNAVAQISLWNFATRRWDFVGVYRSWQHSIEIGAPLQRPAPSRDSPEEHETSLDEGASGDVDSGAGNDPWRTESSEQSVVDVLPSRQEWHVDDHDVVFSPDAVRSPDDGLWLLGGFVKDQLEATLPFYLGLTERGEAYVALQRRIGRFDIFEIDLSGRTNLNSGWARLVVKVSVGGLGVEVAQDVDAGRIAESMGNLAGVSLCDGVEFVNNAIDVSVADGTSLLEQACATLHRQVEDSASGGARATEQLIDAASGVVDQTISAGTRVASDALTAGGEITGGVLDQAGRSCNDAITGMCNVTNGLAATANDMCSQAASAVASILGW